MLKFIVLIRVEVRHLCFWCIVSSYLAVVCNEDKLNIFLLLKYRWTLVNRKTLWLEVEGAKPMWVEVQPKKGLGSIIIEKAQRSLTTKISMFNSRKVKKVLFRPSMAFIRTHHFLLGNIRLYLTRDILGVFMDWMSYWGSRTAPASNGRVVRVIFVPGRISDSTQHRLGALVLVF